MFLALLIAKLDELRPAIEAAEKRRPFLLRLSRTARTIALAGIP
jgi:hypothetical protein